MFEDEFYPLSNFAAFTVEAFGRVWPTGEHAYQAQSFLPGKLQEKVALAKSAHEARMIGQEFKSDRRPDWATYKVEVIEVVFRAKLSQHPYVKEKLLASAGREIIKNVPDDSFWGWGPDQKGENRMGKLWMSLRDELLADVAK
jgi:ribA/ribD-fused uncharacterized protein